MRWTPVLLLALSTPALAGATLAGERLAVGVNDDGSLCDTDRGVCLLYDPDGMGQGAPLGNDMLTPGRAFETWSASWTTAGGAQLVQAGAPDGAYLGGPPIVWTSPARSEDLVYVEGTTSLEGLDVRIAVDVPVGDEVFWTTFTLTATEDLTGLSLARTVDVDPDVYANGGYTTINTADGDVASATSLLNGGKSLALGVVGGEAGLCSWCASPESVREGLEGTRQGDFQIGVASAPVDLAAGESVTVRFAFGLAMSDDAARARADAAMRVDDLDGDGETVAAGDCDDRDASTGSGAPEQADGRDNDCDGEIDEDTVVSDDDGDGFSEAEGDCDDTLDTVYPGADPVSDVRDADCDGLSDDDDLFAEGGQPEGWGSEDVAGGCTSTATPTAPALVVLLLPLLARRRRS